MKKYPLTAPLTRWETIRGFGYLAFELLLLPSILYNVSVFIPALGDITVLNFVYYVVNFFSVGLIFRRFLGENLDNLTRSMYRSLYSLFFGLARYMLAMSAVGYLIAVLLPDYLNANNEAIYYMASSDYRLMVVGAVALVPMAEECLFRGLIFRNLWDKNRTAAYLVSICAFAILHIYGYIRVYTLPEMAIAFLQYLPAGYCLAWAYETSDSIFVPILMHTVINAFGLSVMR